MYIYSKKKIKQMEELSTSLYEFENKRPRIGHGSFIFPSADIIGDIIIDENCYIGSGARIRADYGAICIGNNTAVEENVVTHERPNEKTRIGNSVTIGHAVIIHNATIHDWAIIGMGAIVSDYAELGEWAVVAEGAVVKNNTTIPEKAIAVGIPAKVVAEITLEYQKQWTEYKGIYVDLAKKCFPSFLKKLDVLERTEK